LTTLHSFDGTDGEGVSVGLVLGTDGNFYGVGGAGQTAMAPSSKSLPAAR
jgi:hypothetical protein